MNASLDKRTVALATSCLCAIAAGAFVVQAWPARSTAVATQNAQAIRWEALVPPGWDPLKKFRDSNGSMDDSDFFGQRLMRAIWDNAPTVAAMDGAAVRISGYVVPIETSNGELKEFLLVPYFGACIHSPPPPANQIVHVVASSPVRGVRAMDTVSVSGLLSTEREESAMGMSGYRIQATQVAPHLADEPATERAVSATLHSQGVR